MTILVTTGSTIVLNGKQLNVYTLAATTHTASFAFSHQPMMKEKKTGADHRPNLGKPFKTNTVSRLKK